MLQFYVLLKMTMAPEILKVCNADLNSVSQIMTEYKERTQNSSRFLG